MSLFFIFVFERECRLRGARTPTTEKLEETPLRGIRQRQSCDLRARR